MKLSRCPKCNGKARQIEHDTMYGVTCCNRHFNIDNHFESMSAAMLHWEVLGEREVEEEC